MGVVVVNLYGVLGIVTVVLGVVVIIIGAQDTIQVLVWMDIGARVLVILPARKLVPHDVQVMRMATTAYIVPTTITLGLVPLATSDVLMTAIIDTTLILVVDLVVVDTWKVILVLIFHRDVPSVVVLVLNHVLKVGLPVLLNTVPIQTGLKGGSDIR